MITELQKTNISNLSQDDLKVILDICIEKLGIVDINEAKKILSLGKTRTYQLMKENNTLIIGKHKFLMTKYKE